ncbi:MAG TPA: HPF/RaiA family ribosome-associated protein [Candidatus Acidoferrales bacterium]|jgi:ribosomal subunit interface protein|nr:HPF/RaiA family ribosome-associated protein [Candidatus Acidoferrales bacterium]
MKITYSHMETHFRKQVESDLAHSVQKLERLLKKYDPDLVLLHCSLETIERTQQFSFGLSLSLPTGNLHSANTAADVRSSAKGAIAELEKQVKKHQQKLRKDYEWKRKRARGLIKPGELPA